MSIAKDSGTRKVVSLRLAMTLWQRMVRAANREQMSVADWHRDVLLDAVRKAEREKKAS